MPTMLETAAPAMTYNDNELASNRPYQETPPPQWRPTMPTGAMDGNRALEALVWSQGRPAVAAERLGLPDADSLLAAIVLDDSLHVRLRSIMRSFALLRLMGVAEQLEDAVMGRIEDLDAATVAKLFSQVLSLTDQFTRGGNAEAMGATTDPRDMLMKALPANVRAALRVIQNNGDPAAIYDPVQQEAG